MENDISVLINKIITDKDSPFYQISLKIIELLKTSKVEDPPVFRKTLKKVTGKISGVFGIQGATNFLRHYDLVEGKRKPTLAIYDHAFHFIGGAQKYGLTLAKALEEDFDITIISNRNVTHENFLEWYGLDLKKAGIKIVKIPYFDKRETSHIDPHRIMKGTPNPFHIISRESGNYDIFINNGMLEMVYPLSLISLLVCHFPERRPQSYFYSDKYSYTIYNSKYTAGWIKKRWKYEPHKHIYPPVDMEVYEPGQKKEKLILSVARIEEGGTKKQKELASTFLELKNKFPEVSAGWKLVIAGGSAGDNPYLTELKEIIGRAIDGSIELKINISDDELKELYKKGSVFWHLCGLGQNDPAKVEHFGMTIGEAMQNRLAPIVFDGGGQKEIVDHGRSGFRCTSVKGLIRYTLKLMQDETLRKELGENAYLKSLKFNRERFSREVRQFFKNIIPGI